METTQAEFEKKNTKTRIKLKRKTKHSRGFMICTHNTRSQILNTEYTTLTQELVTFEHEYKLEVTF